MDFVIKYVVNKAAHRETTIPHCPDADVALQAFKKLVAFNRIKVKRIVEITATNAKQ